MPKRKEYAAMKAPARSPTHKFLLGIAAVLIPTILTAFFSFIYTTIDSQRKDRLDFVRGQIVKLYGPLYTLSATNESVWKTLGKNRRPDYHSETPPSTDQVVAWRALVQAVVKPLNEQMEETLLKSGELIRCENIRDALLEFFSFAEELKILSSTWKPEDDTNDKIMQSFEKNMPQAHYPKHLTETLKRELDRLHKRETQLDDGILGLLPGRTDDALCQTPDLVLA
jgi:hypothetical protein